MLLASWSTLQRFEASNWKQKKKIGMGDRDSGGGGGADGADGDDTPKNVNTTLNEVNE